MNSALSLCRRIEALALDTGAVAAAFVPVVPVEEGSAEIFRRFIADGRHSEMAYMERYGDVRDNPALLLEGAQSMLCTAFAYHSAGMPRSPLFADYALGDDYHEALRAALEPIAAAMRGLVPGSATRICIDTAPLRERYWAQRAGLGFIGLNNQLIIPGIGSRVFLAEILWTAQVDGVESLKLEIENCGECGACVRACPLGALDGNGGIDCRRCLSYLTIEHRGELPSGVPLKSGRIYGCDICQEVCQHNKNTKDVEVIDAFAPRESILNLTRDDIADMTPEQYSSTFRHSAIKRVKLPKLKSQASGE